VILVLEIIFQSFGKITDEDKIVIREIMEECYGRLSPHNLEIVDVILFEDIIRMDGYLRREQESFGIFSQGLEIKFVATHEAWTGIPKILVCCKKLQELKFQTRAAVIRHEVAHSILHGAPEYYIFTIPRLLHEASEKYNLPRNYTINILYLVSIGVKDYEATKFLVNHQYIEDQIDYAQHFGRTDADDIDAWNLSKGTPKNALLCVLSRYKDLACMMATVNPHDIINFSHQYARKELAYFREALSSKLLEAASALTVMDIYDTFSKVKLVTDIIVEQLIQIIFKN
jgi:hypothetical protein